MDDKLDANSHILIDGERFYISEDLITIFEFLVEIENEIQSFLGIDELRSSFVELMDCMKTFDKKLKENNVDFEYNFKNLSESFVKNFRRNPPMRSQFIVLFASLDVLFNLHMSYEHETSNENELINLTMNGKNTKNFLNKLFLTDKNQYYKEHKSRLAKIDCTKIRKFRNSLVHFFSIADVGISLAPSRMAAEARKWEELFKKNKQGSLIFLSPDDLYELLKGANKLRLLMWSDDFKKNPQDFQRKIQFVINLVEEKSPVITTLKPKV